MYRVFLLTLIIFPFSITAQTDLGILEKHFQVVGQNQWNEVRTVSVDGKWVDEDYRAYKINVRVKRPDKVRIDGEYDGKKTIEAFDGSLAWIVAPWANQEGVNRMTEGQEIVIRNVFSLGSPLYPVREHLAFSGLMDMEGVLYNTFTLIEGNYKKIYYLDRDNHRLYYEFIENQFGNEKVSILKVIDKYKAYGPMLVPTSVLFEGLEFDREFVFDEIYLGTGANDAIFEYPEGQ